MNPVPADLAVRGVPGSEGVRGVSRTERVEKVAKPDRAANAAGDQTAEGSASRPFAAILDSRRRARHPISGAPACASSPETEDPVISKPTSATLSRAGSIDDELFASTAVVPASDLPTIGAFLRAQLEDSGLFYESHQRRWLSGQYPLARLREEPQNLGVDRVAAQLRFLEHPVFTFRGQAGDSEFAWTVRKETDGEIHCLLHLRGDGRRSDLTATLSLVPHPESPGSTMMRLVVTAKHVSSHPFLWRLVEVAERIRAATGRHVGVEIIDAAQI